MKNLLYSLLFVLTGSMLLFSCATGKDVGSGIATDENGDRNELATEEHVDPEGSILQSEDTLFASILRGACYGTCPIYKMFIYKDGTVILEGIRFMEPRGKHKGHITEKQMQEFRDMAQEIKFFELKDSYDSPITDIPAVTTSIVIDGKRKEVMRRVGYPERILKFEQLFDALLKSVEWEMLEAPMD